MYIVFCCHLHCATLSLEAPHAEPLRDLIALFNIMILHQTLPLDCFLPLCGKATSNTGHSTPQLPRSNISWIHKILPADEDDSWSMGVRYGARVFSARTKRFGTKVKDVLSQVNLLVRERNAKAQVFVSQWRLDERRDCKALIIRP